MDDIQWSETQRLALYCAIPALVIASVVCLLTWHDRTGVATVVSGAVSFALIFGTAYAVRASKRR